LDYKKIESFFDSLDGYKQEKMSIQIIQSESWFPVAIQGDKQFWFPEEVWEIIKEFIITDRSRLLFKMSPLSMARLSGIFEKYFQRRHKNMNKSSIPLEDRKYGIKKGIIKRCEITPTKYAEIMESEFQVKPKVEKNYDWLRDFAVGEEVLVKTNKKSVKRKGVIRKIGKTIQVELYHCERITCGELRGCPFDYNTLLWMRVDRLRWLETFCVKITVYNRNTICKRGDNVSFDALFDEGVISHHFGDGAEYLY